MSEILAKSLVVFLTVTITSVIFAWIGRGAGNRRLYFLGGIPVLMALAIVGFDLTRKRYNESDYTTKQVIVKQCGLDKMYNGIIIADDDSTYPFNRSLIRRAGFAPESAKALCQQKNLKLWINPYGEISAFEGEQASIPIQVGIVRDDSKHDFLIIAISMGALGVAIMGSAYRYDRMGKKLNMKF
jgi:hypothetical protein